MSDARTQTRVGLIILILISLPVVPLAAGVLGPSRLESIEDNLQRRFAQMVLTIAAP